MFSLIKAAHRESRRKKKGCGRGVGGKGSIWMFLSTDAVRVVAGDDEELRLDTLLRGLIVANLKKSVLC